MALAMNDHAQGIVMQKGHSRTLRIIAIFVILKGLAAVAASWGLLSVAHHNFRHFAYWLINYFHLNLDAYYLNTIYNFTDLLANENLRTLVLTTWGYAAIRFTEGYGLWKSRVWAEWLAALSGGVYLPLEIGHLIKHVSIINTAVLMTNAAVVAYMIFRLRWRRIEASKQSDLA